MMMCCLRDQIKRDLDGVRKSIVNLTACLEEYMGYEAALLDLLKESDGLHCTGAEADCGGERCSEAPSEGTCCRAHVEPEAAMRRNAPGFKIKGRQKWRVEISSQEPLDRMT